MDTDEAFLGRKDYLGGFAGTSRLHNKRFT
jgi:hypothetical protein